MSGTRFSTKTFRNNWLLGELWDHLPPNTLPTELDIAKVYFYSKQFLLHLKDTRQLCDDAKEDLYESVAKEIIEIWQKASIPCFDDLTIKRYLKKFIPKLENLVASWKNRKQNDEQWIQNSLKPYEKLFDCAKCPCFRAINSLSDITKITCVCPEDQKISITKSSAKGDFSDLEFYIDQKSERKFWVGWSKDVKDYRKKRKNEEKLERLSKQARREYSDLDLVDTFEMQLDDDSDNFETSDLEKNVQRSPEVQITSPFVSQNLRNRYEYPESMETSRRYDLSDHATAALMNSVTNDLSKIVGFEKPNQYHVGVTKVCKMKERYGQNLIHEHSENIENLECIGFDGKKSHGMAAHSKQVLLDKYTVIKEPGSQYIDHFVPNNGFGITLASELLNLLSKYKSVDSLNAALCDGCNTNVGEKGGAMRHLELEVNASISNFS